MITPMNRRVRLDYKRGGARPKATTLSNPSATRGCQDSCFAFADLQRKPHRRV